MLFLHVASFLRARSVAGAADRMSRHGTAIAHTAVKIRCQSDAGVERELHERGSEAAVHVVTAAVEQDGLHGLITVRIISKARPCANLTGMIEADLAPTSHVSGSHQLGRAFHEVIIFTIIVTRQRCGGAMCSACTEPVDRSDG